MEGKKKTTSEFIEEARAIYGDSYNYESVNYINSITHVIIKCPKHGELRITPGNHLQGNGCRKCSNEARKSNTQEFVRKAKDIHEDFYDYEFTNYINSDTKVDIKCPKHGLFSVIPSIHLKGHKCRKCAIESQTGNTEEFIKRAQDIHKNEYLYEKSIYIKASEKIIITCPKHGDWATRAAIHLKGSKCPKCDFELKAKNKRLSQEEFLKKCFDLRGDLYDYSLSEYNGYYSKIRVICPNHGIIEILPAYHLIGSGCPACGQERSVKLNTHTFEDFIQQAIEVHDGKYTYTEDKYTKKNDKTEICCPIHGNFLQVATDHLRGQGCPKCAHSNSEKYISQIFKANDIFFEPEKRFKDCINPETGYPLPFDFYTPTSNTIIEYDGKQHFEPVEHWGGQKEFEKLQFRDSAKTKYCLDNKINLIRISFNENLKLILPYIVDFIKNGSNYSIVYS